jgi:putative DNA primase/helicase
VRLIVVDLISAYMGGADSHGNAETREVLEPLADMANRLRIAVVAVTHLNKGGAGNQNALNRFAGSIAFVVAARSAFAVIEDSEDETRRLLLQAKNNLGPKCKGLAFRIEQRLVADNILSSNIMFEGEHVDRAIDEALRASETGDGAQIRTTKDEAADFLADIHKSGPMGVLDIERGAREAGLLGPDAVIGQSRPFREARRKIGAQSRRDGGVGGGGRWVCELPTVAIEERVGR